MYDVDVSSFAAIQILLRIYCVFVALLKGQKSGNPAVPAMSAFSGIFQHGPRIGAGRFGRPFLSRKTFSPFGNCPKSRLLSTYRVGNSTKKEKYAKAIAGIVS